jgi:lysophospholipase L1-like esterase
VRYHTATEDMGYRGDGAGRTYSVWRDGRQVDEQAATLGEGHARLSLGSGDNRAIVYLPEGMRPTVLGVEGIGGDIQPSEPQPRWIAYGDSVAEGWIASAPALAWPAIAARDHGLDITNLGYAGAARGELVSAEQIADLHTDVISITHGTNCWTRIPHSVEVFRAQTAAFLDIIRQGQPATPVLVARPVVRPDAEEKPNRLGATLAELRAVMEEVARERIAAGDARLRLVPGRELIDEGQLGDGIHPDDAGHRAIAAALGPEVRAMLA